MKAWVFAHAGSRVPHSGGAKSPRLKRMDEGLRPTPRRGSPDHPCFSPVCPYGLTGRGSYRTVITNDIGVSNFGFSGLK